MPKLDVGVGDEFPAEDGRHIHHHHYYHGCRPRRPFRLLRLILSILLIVFVVRLVGAVWHAPLGLGHDYGWPEPFTALAGILPAIAVIGLILWLLRTRDKD